MEEDALLQASRDADPSLLQAKLKAMESIDGSSLTFPMLTVGDC
jgi:hypothetical protein